MDTLYEEVKRLEKPHQYYVDLTTELLKLKRELIASTTESVTTKEKSIGRLW